VRGVIYAVERRPGGEATRGAALATVASAAVIPASTVVASTTLSAVVPVGAWGVFRCGFGCRVSGGDGGRIAWSGLFGCTFEIVGGVVLAVILLFR
jgi:hypothetical protein